MLVDPENSAWSSYSVEFCGGTHLKNTREAINFVLYEESAIAKGIRRMSAYTGAAAVEAEARADDMQHKLNAISQLQGIDFINSVSSFKPILDGTLMSLPRKETLRAQLNALVEKVKKMKKEEAAALAARGVTDAAAAAVEAKKAGIQYIVISFKVGTDAKLGREMLDAMAQVNPEASCMIFSTDAEKKKTAAFCQVSELHASGGLDAKSWVNFAMECMGGKGGGKDALNATGQAKTVDNMDKAILQAKKYVQK